MKYFFKGYNDKKEMFEGSNLDYRADFEYSYINKIKVRTESIGTWTGLMDKNDKRVYHTINKSYDILLSKNGTQFTLLYNEIEGRLFIARPKNNKEIKQYPLNDNKGFWINECEIIGNSYGL